jgi:NitT/TauT family transport system ATP-binding protein
MVPVMNESATERMELSTASSVLPAIQVDGVDVRYAVGKDRYKTILENISLDVQDGEFVVLLGQTGCGKSTLLRMILGQEQPAGGAIRVDGRLVTRVDAHCGYVPQRYSLFPDRTVLGNLMMGPETSRYHILGRLKPGFRAFQRQLKQEALKQLHHMGLHEADADKFPHQLSGGMQQRVAIAQTLMMKAKVLLMDEAFSALDPGTRSSLQHLLRNVWQESRPTVVFVTHNTAEALFLGSRLIVLAREQHGDDYGARIALDMKLPESGMSLAKNGKEFLDLVDHIEQCSRGASV